MGFISQIKNSLEEKGIRNFAVDKEDKIKFDDMNITTTLEEKYDYPDSVIITPELRKTSLMMTPQEMAFYETDLKDFYKAIQVFIHEGIIYQEPLFFRRIESLDIKKCQQNYGLPEVVSKGDNVEYIVQKILKKRLLGKPAELFRPWCLYPFNFLSDRNIRDLLFEKTPREVIIKKTT